MVSKQNDKNYEKLRPWKFGAMQYMHRDEENTLIKQSIMLQFNNPYSFTGHIHSLQTRQTCCQWRRNTLSKAEQSLSTYWLCVNIWIIASGQFSGELYTNNTHFITIAMVTGWDITKSDTLHRGWTGVHWRNIVLLPRDSYRPTHLKNISTQIMEDLH